MPFRTVVLTISDSRSRGDAEDRSGPAITEQLSLLDAALVHRQIVPDEVEAIRTAVRTWLGRADLILATGGTGVAARDVTPEAVAPLIERPLPGFGEAMRLHGFAGNPLTILSRGGAGVIGTTLVVWLPGSVKAASECVTWLAPAIKHACGLLRGETRHDADGAP